MLVTAAPFAGAGYPESFLCFKGATPMAVPLIDLSKQHQLLSVELQSAFKKLVKSGRFILGPDVEAFEQQLAAACGVQHAVGLSNGTDAILVALMALDIKPGDEVITTPFTFFCTAGCVTRLGAKPVFVDIDANTFNLDANQLEGAITKQTKAIIPVHLYGQAAPMDAIMAVANRHGLPVIEDCAQANGAKYQDQPVGSLGRIGTFSFYPTKNLPALGDAGAIVTNDADLAARIRKLRVHGSVDGNFYDEVGGNFRLDALHAALLAVKLPHLGSWVRKRRDLAERYNNLLEELPLATPFVAPEAYHAYNVYTVRIFGGQRDAVMQHLQANDIGCRVYYSVPLHLQPCFAHLGYRRGQFPVVEQAAQEALSLPIFPEMTEKQQDQVIDVLRAFFAAD
jgi:dTDP-4-amino-4,6-dideoxygalactose transaminase